jgi:ribonuclease R
MKRLTSIRDLRQEIIEVLKRSPSAVQLVDLSKQLRIKSDTPDYDHLRQVLTTMAEEGAIQRLSRRRYAYGAQHTDGFTGVLTVYHDAASIKTNDSEIPVIHIRRQHMLTALDGDTVLVRPLALRQGKKVRGEVVAVVERSMAPISGTVEYDGSFYYLVPDEHKYMVDFLVAERNLHVAKPGQKVIAQFLRWEHANASPECKILEVLGQSGTAVVEFNAIRKEFRLPPTFPSEVEAEAAACQPPTTKVPKGRTDLRKELIITIDPVDARDFDDALSLRDLGRGEFELGVHIADVTHYVQHGSALDREARKRGNSTYLVDAVVPMLPERLSNDLCSLVPGKPRYAYSVFMSFSKAGILKEYRIEETVIHSKRRYSYDEVQTIIDTGKGDHADLIMQLHRLARTLNARRMKTGGVDFETQEVKYILNEQKMPVGALLKTRTDATSLVEECMLAANKTVAEHVEALRKVWRVKETPPFMYRIHDTPDPEKLADAVAVIRALGLDVPSGKLGPTQLNAILQQATDRPDKAVIHSLLLRSQAKAVYAEHNIGHFGLGFKHYAHFTSPIRRYPDLFIHRVLKEYAKGSIGKGRWADILQDAGEMADHCSATERSSVEAERASTKLAQVMMAREHLGEDHLGIVTGVTNFGVFVQVKDLLFEGLLHIRDLTDDYYFFDEQRWRLVGRRTRRTFQYGTEVYVRIVKVNLEKRNIDLVLADVPMPVSARNVDEAARPTEKREPSRDKRPSSRGKRTSSRRGSSKRRSRES